jgi:O-antigen/teichoic acid export membrane protein
VTENKNSYRQIFKTTSLFGGVQVFGILISIIRSKAIAVLLGPAGIGVNSLLNSTLSMVGSFTNFGLGTSAVKNVAAANESQDSNRIGLIVAVLKKLVWITGLLGAVLTMILSPWLSELTFGNRNYTLAFIWISVTLLMSQISVGQGVILRGTRQLKFMTQSSMIGAVLGLLIDLPIYYFYGIKGIVPTIIITSLSSLVLTTYFSTKIKIPKVHVDLDTVKKQGREMLFMGFMLSLSGLIAMGTSYLLRIYISHAGGIDQVGLYSAGFAIINTYVGLIFTAMSTDYYPRLSGVAHDNIKTSQLINEQSEMAILILSPIILIFIIFIHFVTILLYSHKFIPINGMIQWAALGMFFKAGSWAIAFILLAKGASKIFFWNELIANIYILGLNVLGYKFFGLNGLGISFIAGYLLYFIQVFVLSRNKYSFYFTKSYKKIFITQLLFAVVGFILFKAVSSPWNYIPGVLIILLSGLYSLYEINKRLDIKDLLSIIQKKRQQ